MKRQKLRTQLAEVIQQTMRGHRLTVPNCRRYCNADVRASFSIRKDTKIINDDWIAAIEISKPKPVINSVPKVDRTPSQPFDPDNWKHQLLKRLHDKIDLFHPLEFETRRAMILISRSHQDWKQRLKTWQAGLLEHRC